MHNTIYNQLQLREIFHLEFLRWLGRKLKPEQYALKGGANLRFFFNSMRYSEDMDLDAAGVTVESLKETSMKILGARSFCESLKPFGIERISPPDITKAKQTETTQRFKVHLFTASGEDLFTKVEFSRRGLKDHPIVQPVSDVIMRAYKAPPLLCPHYGAETALRQKIEALANRSVVQARDVFDLFLLFSQANNEVTQGVPIVVLEKARENTLTISFEQFRDAVVSYLAPDDRRMYENAAAWDEIKLHVAENIEKMGKDNAE